jgi:hypothetical protein
MERLFVVPAKEGSVIRYPKSVRVLSVVGGYVPKNQYWMRRVADKDVLDCTNQKEKEEASVILPEVKEIKIPKEIVEFENKDEQKMTRKKVAKKKTTNK